MVTEEFPSYTTGKVFKVRFRASRKSSNVLYLITCRRCGLQYVGEMGQPLHMTSHIVGLKNLLWQSTSVAEHMKNQTWQSWLLLSSLKVVTNVYGKSYKAGGSGPWEVRSLWE